MADYPTNCPFCGEGYPPGRDDAAPAFEMIEAAQAVLEAYDDLGFVGGDIDLAIRRLAETIPK